MSNNNFFGVILGFNKYDDSINFPDLEFAENDAGELYDILIDPKYGNYPKENIQLLTGEVTNDRIQRALNVQIIKDRNENDTVLVYYSGHGFIAGNLNKAYLGTPETTIHHLLENPLAGIQIKFLQDWFLESNAGNVVFIIDCCHSGAFLLNAYKGKEDVFQLPLVDERYYKSEGRIAFVSCPRGVMSRESSDYQHGIFTYHLLEGLKSKAIEPFSGDVTMESLISYVEAKAPANQPPVHYGHSKRLVLTSPKVVNIRQYNQNLLNIGINSPLDLPESKEIYPLSNPLDRRLSIIDMLLRNLENNPLGIEVSQRIIEAVRKTFNSELAFVVRVEINYRVSDKFNNAPKESIKVKEEIIRETSPFLFAPEDEILRSRFGVIKLLTGTKGLRKKICILPLWTDYPREFFVLLGLGDKSDEYGQVIGSMVKSLYESTGGFHNISISKIENRILDGLKRNFGYVPIAIYDRRFQSFSSELNKIKINFEPIVNLGRKNPQIDSWEALARDPETNQAPFSLFNAAELWGPGFIAELDKYCLNTAVNEYLRLWKIEHGNQKKDQLAVNLYPDTLYDEEYFNELKRIILEQDLLKPKELVLEVSEKRSIRKSMFEKVTKSSIELLEEKITEYSRIIGISFAIDDFGIGYSSIERLVRLDLNHVKIDRQVLHHRFPQITISYVLDMVKRMHTHQTYVIVEGIDGYSSISLYDLYKLGVCFVQGHLIRRASPNLHDLNNETIKLLIKQINIKPKENAEDIDDDTSPTLDADLPVE